ncbi:MAG: amidohydrolase [Rhodobacteraceae bacterium]|nr:amidohydrolase [Paracoccaceae bacterium]
MKVAIAQITSSDQPAENLATVLSLMNQAAGQDILFLPEVTNCVSLDRAHQLQVLEPYDGNAFIAAICERARLLRLWVALGSVTVKTDGDDGRFANRSVMINAQGKIVAFYDKIHMFDVTLSDTERYHESKGYRPGAEAAVVQTPWAELGLSICYDLRFAALHRALAHAGAKVLSVPSAFARATGEAHWHVLLRARAIETGCFVIAAAQTGVHSGSGRETFGHSLIVGPWGEVILDAGLEIGLHFATLDLGEVDRARARVASLQHDRPFGLKRYQSHDKIV